MSRPGRIVAFVRVLIVAIGLCLLGAIRPPQPLAGPSSDPHTALADRVDHHDPGDLLFEPDDDLQTDGAARPHPRTAFIAPTGAAQRVIMARGPPVHPRPVAGRPRSSRGPPEPGLTFLLRVSPDLSLESSS